MKGMNEERQERNWNHSLLISVVLLMLPLLYFLSSGPAIYLMNRGYISKDGNLYAPLQWACDHCEPFHQAVKWYLRLFL